MHPPPAPSWLTLGLLLHLAAASPVKQDGASVALVGEEAAPEAGGGPGGGLGGGPGCKRGDRYYLLGDTWQEDDGCMSCTCERGGQARCQAYMCQVTCDNPRRVQGECCPACDRLSVVTQFQSCASLGNCTLRCTHGFVVDESGCYTCQCQQGAACTLDCPAGYSRDSTGGELCECACPAMETCSKRCTHGYRMDTNGCSLCACLTAAEAAAAAAGGSAEDISRRNCIDTVRGDRDRDDGEYWFDGCRGCYCSGGRTLCELVSCRDDPRALRRMAELALCSENAVVLAGCVSCRCLNGRALCEVASCPPAACPHPLPPDNMACCATCPPDRSRLEEGEEGGPCPGGHAHGTSWRLTDCTSCRCRHGRAECFEQRCRPLQCGLQFTPKGMCCPVCLDEPGSKPHPVGPMGGGAGACWWRNQSHPAGEEWIPDECTHCQCDPAGSGSSSCTQMVCPTCSDQPSRCCPACTDGGADGGADGNASSGADNGTGGWADSGAGGWADSRTGGGADRGSLSGAVSGAGGVTVLASLLAVTGLLVLLVLALVYFLWQRGRRQTLDIAHVDTRTPAKPARPAATYTYNMIPAEKSLPPR